ncbi:uncharacterized protein LOC134534581 [Bacillus rossius redtenbacheri]|uniref:uncharacterized protein LOC134534581 n=1 Tax=Bacillus rossius redtenbacheri TaxID=93214 RepID=UPI002FDE084B
MSTNHKISSTLQTVTRPDGGDPIKASYFLSAAGETSAPPIIKSARATEEASFPGNSRPAMKVLVAAVCWLAAGASCEQAGGAGEVGDSPLAAGLRVAAAAYRQCRSGGHLLACLQLKALKAADRALAADRVPLLEGVELVRTGAGRGLQGEGATPLDEERLWGQPGRLGALLVDRAARLLDSHALRISPRKLFGSDDETTVDSDGRRRKDKGGYGGIMLMGGLLKAKLLALSMAGLAGLAGTALLVAKVALVLATVIGLSKLLGGGGGGEKVTTYEVVKHPVHVSGGGHEYGGHEYGGYYGASGGGGGGGGHIGRSLGDAHEMAYKKQAPVDAASRPKSA